MAPLNKVVVMKSSDLSEIQLEVELRPTLLSSATYFQELPKTAPKAMPTYDEENLRRLLAMLPTELRLVILELAVEFLCPVHFQNRTPHSEWEGRGEVIEMPSLEMPVFNIDMEHREMCLKHFLQNNTFVFTRPSDIANLRHFAQKTVQRPIRIEEHLRKIIVQVGTGAMSWASLDLADTCLRLEEFTLVFCTWDEPTRRDPMEWVYRWEIDRLLDLLPKLRRFEMYNAVGDQRPWCTNGLREYLVDSLSEPDEGDTSEEE